MARILYTYKTDGVMFENGINTARKLCNNYVEQNYYWKKTKKLRYILLGISTFPPYPLLVYNSYIDLNLRSFRFIKVNTDNIKYKRLKDNIFITTKEQTIPSN